MGKMYIFYPRTSYSRKNCSKNIAVEVFPFYLIGHLHIIADMSVRYHLVVQSYTI